MKSKPYILWLIFGGLALLVWLAWPSGRNVAPDTRPESREITAASPMAAPISPPVSIRQAPLPVPTVFANAPDVVQPPKPLPTTRLAASATAPSLKSTEPGAPIQSAQIEVGRVRRMISDYHTLMGENPVGTNAEIMKQMTGGNAKQATLGPPEGISLNAQGELIDQWGTAYFFHQLSRDKMEVRSAGPDKVMWTGDDIIAR